MLKIAISAPQFPKIGGFFATFVVFLDENSPTRRKFSDKLKFKGDCPLPHPCNDPTDLSSSRR